MSNSRPSALAAERIRRRTMRRLATNLAILLTIAAGIYILSGGMH